MRNEERGMKKYAPYRSLVEQSTALALMRENRNRCERKTLSSDEAYAINEILVNYAGEEIRLSYWKMGRVYREEGTITKIAPYERTIYLNGLRITLSSLQSLERK